MKPTVQLPQSTQPLQQAGQPACGDTALLVQAVLNHAPALPLDVLELGCGTGLAALQLLLARPQWRVSGIELQGHLAEMARRNAGAIGLPLRVHTADLRTWHPERRFQVVLANPPHIPVSSGRLPADSCRALARHELACTMHDAVEAVAHLLAPQGQAWLLYPLQRRDELATTCHACGLELRSTHSQPQGRTAVFGIGHAHADA